MMYLKCSQSPLRWVNSCEELLFELLVRPLSDSAARDQRASFYLRIRRIPAYCSTLRSEGTVPATRSTRQYLTHERYEYIYFSGVSLPVHGSGSLSHVPLSRQRRVLGADFGRLYPSRQLIKTVMPTHRLSSK